MIGPEGGLEALQVRLEGAAAEVKATTRAARNKNKFKIPDGDGGGEIEESHTEEEAQEKRLGKPEGDLMPEWEPFPEVKLCRDQL